MPINWRFNDKQTDTSRYFSKMIGPGSDKKKIHPKPTLGCQSPSRKNNKATYAFFRTPRTTRTTRQKIYISDTNHLKQPGN